MRSWTACKKNLNACAAVPPEPRDNSTNKLLSHTLFLNGPPTHLTGEFYPDPARPPDTRVAPRRLGIPSPMGTRHRVRREEPGRHGSPVQRLSTLRHSSAGTGVGPKHQSRSILPPVTLT